MSEELALESAGLGALGGAIASLSIFIIIFYILVIIADWKIFKKSGEPGWKSIIPIYNIYILFKIIGLSPWYILLMLLPAFTEYLPNWFSFIALIGFLVASVQQARYLGRAFNKGTGFKIGLFFLPNIFQLILGFDNSEYDSNVRN